MKKFLAILAVLALTVVSSVAFAEVTVSGSIDIRNLATNNTTDWNSDSVNNGADRVRNTQERIRINIDAKHENVKGRVTIENDWDVWGRFEQAQATASVSDVVSKTTATYATTDAGRLKIREGWIDFTIPGAGPAHVKVGHQFLQLGNGWFFRSGKYGSDAWLVGLPGKNTVAFVNAKFKEWTNGSQDDTDAYVLLDNFKISDTQVVGAYLVRLNDPMGKYFSDAFFSPAQKTHTGLEMNLDNLGLWFNGKIGPVNLQAELDVQSGKVKDPANADMKFKGKQLIVQANVPVNDLTVNATIAQGSGVDQNSGDSDLKQVITALDADPHYTFVYEYFTNTACITKFDAATGAPKYGKNTGFCNTTALNLGASYKVSPKVSVSLDYWMLTATEKVAINGGALDDELGTEVDVKVNVNLYDNLSWNWALGRLMPGKAYDSATKTADNVDAIQGVLSYKF